VKRRTHFLVGLWCALILVGLPAVPVLAAPVPPTLALTDPSYQTSNGARTAGQLRDELGIAGYGGPWDVESMLAAYARATATPLGAAYKNVLPNGCAWDTLGTLSVYFCTYPSGDFAAWQDASSAAVMIAFTPSGGTPTITDAGKRLLGMSPVVVPFTAPPVPQPSNSDIVVRGLSVEAFSRSFPTVQGLVCNNAQGWTASNIAIQFEFYYDSLLPTLDSGRTAVYSVSPGECQRFNASLTALQPWRPISVKRVTWTWSPLS
jgi:hypothetical protein